MPSSSLLSLVIYYPYSLLFSRLLSFSLRSLHPFSSFIFLSLTYPIFLPLPFLLSPSLFFYPLLSFRFLPSPLLLLLYGWLQLEAHTSFSASRWDRAVLLAGDGEGEGRPGMDFICSRGVRTSQRRRDRSAPAPSPSPSPSLGRATSETCAAFCFMKGKSGFPLNSCFHLSPACSAHSEYVRTRSHWYDTCTLARARMHPPCVSLDAPLIRDCFGSCGGSIGLLLATGCQTSLSLPVCVRVCGRVMMDPHPVLGIALVQMLLLAHRSLSPPASSPSASCLTAALLLSGSSAPLRCHNWPQGGPPCFHSGGLK